MTAALVSWQPEMGLTNPGTGFLRWRHALIPPNP
ncbi:hypothetical protein GobsT_42820 [Gemmata obscuriglobus]|nr:hypothetical protein GobsT_42820 [Gemmata obscuriglobus]VTS08645.1 unnamed protein product [Gemmata obscuriglobus UQM 2246]